MCFKSLFIGFVGDGVGFLDLGLGSGGVGLGI